VVATLVNNHIKIAFIEVGYWQTNQTISLKHTPSQYANIISSFHNAGIKCYAWAEGSVSTPTVRLNNPPYAVIDSVVSLGFDGWADDVEVYQGTVQQKISYLNSIANNYPALGNDQNRNIYPNLMVSSLVPMFYGATQSRFELPDTLGYWNNVFYNPGSPVILGLMNYPQAATHPFSWQLDQCKSYIYAYSHTKLTGFSLWLYEMMTPSDWAYWKTWIESF
jgi:hypothetical protein